MTRRWTNFVICGLTVALLSVNATAQKKPPVSGAENGLVGIKLYDSGQRVIAVYGSPLEIHPVTFGASAIGPGGGGGAGGGGGRAGGPRGGGAGVGSSTASSDSINGWDFGNEMLRQGRGDDGGGLSPSGLGGPGGGGGGRPGGGGGGGGATGGGDGVIYTRWVYKRGMSKYGFILDRQNRVVQIEAIGMQDGRVKTRKGAIFGSSFGTLIKKYGTPDGYEINGDSIVVRFLQRSKVAFRLNRLGKDKPHQVTGIVVAGGKA